MKSIAASGKASREGLVGNPNNRFFTTKEVGGYDRLFDSEVKLLENIASKFSSNRTVRGAIKLVSERPYCDSCSGVISQFKKMFPNIKIEQVNGVKR